MSTRTRVGGAGAARLLGFAREQVRVIASDADFRLPAADLRAAVEADPRTPVRVPFCVAATRRHDLDRRRRSAAGARGAVRRARHVGLHVDGAYGAPGC